MTNNIRNPKHYHSGTDDGFEPLSSLDLGKVSDFDELATELKHTSFGGRAMGEAVDVLYQMVTDPDVFVVGTLSGAMTPAKMGLLLCEMIDRGMINAVVTTGALMTHGMVEGFGMTHFKYRFGQMDDAKLYNAGYDRIYDTLELEKNLDDLELLVDEVLKQFEPGQIVSSHEVNEKMGEYLNKTIGGNQRAILKSAYLKKVPVYIPAFSDSEYGLDFALFNRKQQVQGRKQLIYAPMSDLEHLGRIFLQQKKLGIFTIGGGVPRNWAQEVPPYLQLISYRLPRQALEFPEDAYKKRYQYGVRICPEPVYWGGLSGATFSEGVSWGKFVPESEGGRFAEVLADATIAWPIVLKAVIQRMEKNTNN